MRGGMGACESSRGGLLCHPPTSSLISPTAPQPQTTNQQVKIVGQILEIEESATTRLYKVVRTDHPSIPFICLCLCLCGPHVASMLHAPRPNPTPTTKPP